MISDILSQLQVLESRITHLWQLLRLDTAIEQMKELEHTMQDPLFWQQPEQAGRITKQYESLRADISLWNTLLSDTRSLIELATEAIALSDTVLLDDISEQYQLLLTNVDKQEFFVLFDGPHDTASAFVSIYAGSGGTEAQDWAEMLTRMIFRFCEKKEFFVTILDETKGQEAGIKSISFRVDGRYAYGYLQSEHGTHRLVRISPFDSESMRHTSFANIEVIPEIETHDVVIDPNDLRIDTFMAGGNGGQSVNTTYSAVRVVHIPTGIVVSCQNEKSQQQNKATALKILYSRLVTLKEEEEAKEREVLRGEVKAAEWGSQIRSYVLHPYKMVKDLRTRHESSDPDAVLAGELDGYMEAFLRWKKHRKPIE